MLSNNFIDRHNGPRENEIPGMLDTIGVKTLEELIAQTVPASIRMKD